METSVVTTVSRMSKRESDILHVWRPSAFYTHSTHNSTDTWYSLNNTLSNQA